MQKKTIIKSDEKVHGLLVNFLKRKINFYNSPKFKKDYDIPVYYSSFYNFIGLFQIKSFLKIKINFFLNFYYVIKDLFSIFKYINLKSFNNFPVLQSRIVLSWGGIKNFKSDGSFYDNNLNVNTNKIKDVYWIILYTDKKLPSKVNKNILIITLQNNISFNIFFFIKHILSKIKYLFIDINYFFFSISSHNFFSYKILKIVESKINKKVKAFLFMYESQPYQNRLIKFLKEKKIISIGYIHFPPLALPVNMIKKKYSPSRIILNGADQKKCFFKLGWKNNQIITIPSTRFLKKNKNYSNKIFLPISIKSKKKIINAIKNLIFKHKINLKKFKIQNHPLAKNSKIHKNLIMDINNLKKKSFSNAKKKIYLKKNFSIFIGASGALVEALERGCNVVQIAEDPILDCYKNFFWKEIKINNFDKNIFTYSLKRKQRLIKFGNKLKNLDLFFN